MNPSVTSFIKPTLERIEKDRGARIWFAVESGSRAWGFESTDSDYDVRFIYLSPLKDYLTVYPHRDFIENADIVSPDPLLDFSGGGTFGSFSVCEQIESRLFRMDAVADRLPGSCDLKTRAGPGRAVVFAEGRHAWRVTTTANTCATAVRPT